MTHPLAAEARRLRTEEALSSRQIRERLGIGKELLQDEGAKTKPWRQQHELSFTNSDPGLVELFVRFVEALGVDRQRLTCRVSIHESADALGACRWWADRIGIEMSDMKRPTLKRHKPSTNRRNKGDDYYGCLVGQCAPKPAAPRPRRRSDGRRVRGVVGGVRFSLRSDERRPLDPFWSGVV